MEIKGKDINKIHATFFTLVAATLSFGYISYKLIKAEEWSKPLSLEILVISQLVAFFLCAFWYQGILNAIIFNKSVFRSQTSSSERIKFNKERITIEKAMKRKSPRLKGFISDEKGLLELQPKMIRKS